MEKRGMRAISDYMVLAVWRSFSSLCYALLRGAASSGLLSTAAGRDFLYSSRRQHLVSEPVSLPFSRPTTVFQLRRSENHWPVIDVTRRSIEETAASVMKLLARRHGMND
jgi:hypothetical protein